MTTWRIQWTDGKSRRVTSFVEADTLLQAVALAGMRGADVNSVFRVGAVGSDGQYLERLP